MSRLKQLRLPNNVTYDLGEKSPDLIVAQNVTSSAFTADSTYDDWGYRASLAVTGMTVDHVPEVIFDGTDSDVEKIAQHCTSYNGGVYIYASVDIGTVTANTVKGIKVVSS